MSEENKVVQEHGTETEIVKESKPYHPIFPNGKYEKVESQMIAMPTWVLVLVLLCALGILKTFIYMKDSSKHGK